MKKAVIAVLIICAVLLVMFTAFFQLTPQGRTLWNNWFHAVQKADDASRYATRRQVEDMCRAMQASYRGDVLTWEQYRDSDNSEKASWAEQAKMRANKTAAMYNEYVLKNSYVWEGNVPDDIAQSLAYVE